MHLWTGHLIGCDLTKLGRIAQQILTSLPEFLLSRFLVQEAIRRKVIGHFKGANKHGQIYVGRSTTSKYNVLFCAHTLCMNSLPEEKFQLDSFSARSKQLTLAHGQGQKSEQKHSKNFVGLITFFLLTMA